MKTIYYSLTALACMWSTLSNGQLSGDDLLFAGNYSREIDGCLETWNLNPDKDNKNFLLTVKDCKGEVRLDLVEMINENGRKMLITPEAKGSYLMKASPEGMPLFLNADGSQSDLTSLDYADFFDSMGRPDDLAEKAMKQEQPKPQSSNPDVPYNGRWMGTYNDLPIEFIIQTKDSKNTTAVIQYEHKRTVLKYTIENNVLIIKEPGNFAWNGVYFLEQTGDESISAYWASNSGTVRNSFNLLKIQ